jgi:hypothetical protein
MRATSDEVRTTSASLKDEDTLCSELFDSIALEFAAAG